MNWTSLKTINCFSYFIAIRKRVCLSYDYDSFDELSMLCQFIGPYRSIEDAVFSQAIIGKTSKRLQNVKQQSNILSHWFNAGDLFDAFLQEKRGKKTNGNIKWYYLVPGMSRSNFQC